jgi:NAD(P)-dependent dehydrogenase (short-subunit alcohol dehydrogenase family)
VPIPASILREAIMEGQSPTIAVVGGTGAEGSAIALRLGHVGYRVIIGTRDSAKGVRVTAELNNGSCRKSPPLSRARY